MGTLHHLRNRAPQLDELLRDLPGRSRLLTARQLAEERRSRWREECLPTAVPACDRLFGGGLRRGEMVEVVGGRSSGRFSLVLSALAAVTGRGEPAALVDLGDSLDPQAAADAGVDLEQLLWARPRKVKEALASAEAILTLGMPLVVVDLGLPPLAGGRGAEAAWLRLARTAREKRTALLVASPYRASGTAAHVVLQLRGRRAAWQCPLGGRRSGGIQGGDRQGERHAPVLLSHLEAELEILKSRDRKGSNALRRDRTTWWSGDAVRGGSTADTVYDDTVYDDAVPSPRLPLNAPQEAARAIA
jgi:hypothetical protein